MDDQHIDTLTAHHLKNSADLSYRLEENQHAMLSQMSGRFLSCIPVLFLALILVSAFAYQSTSSDVCHIVLAVLAIIVAAVLAAAFIVSQYATRYFNHSPLASPLEMADFVAEHGPFKSRTEAAHHYCGSLQVPYTSLQWANEKAQALILTAQILLIVSIGLALASAIALVVLGILFG